MMIGCTTTFIVVRISFIIKARELSLKQKSWGGGNVLVAHTVIHKVPKIQGRRSNSYLKLWYFKGAPSSNISLCRNLQWGGAQLTDQRAYITTDDIHKPRARAITTQ